MRIVKISCAIILISSLSACSYFSDKNDSTTPAQPIAENSASSEQPTLEEVSFSETVIEEEPIAPRSLPVSEPPTIKSAEAQVTLTQKGNNLKSKQIVNWNDVEPGFILFSWIPPKDSSCKPTTFPIKKYQDEKSLTFTQRSINDANNKICNGLWTVTITEKPNKILAKASLQVGQQNTINNSSK